MSSEPLRTYLLVGRLTEPVTPEVAVADPPAQT